MSEVYFPGVFYFTGIMKPQIITSLNNNTQETSTFFPVQQLTMDPSKGRGRGIPHLMLQALKKSQLVDTPSESEETSPGGSAAPSIVSFMSYFNLDAFLIYNLLKSKLWFSSI